MVNISNADYSRIRYIFLFLLSLFFLVIVKLFVTQVVHRNYWVKIATAQHKGVHKIQAQRGEIYTSDGFPIALSGYTYELYIDPSLSDVSSEELQKVFDVVYKDFPKESSLSLEDKKVYWANALMNKNLRFYSLEKQISSTLKQELQNLQIKGLGFLPVPTRTYPNLESYSHILGFVGNDESGQDKGYFGLEGYYDGDLKGVDGFVTQESSAGGSPILFGEYSSYSAIQGGNLHLTLDRVMQNMSFNALKTSVEKFGASSGTVVIVNPKTGAILSLVNYPTYSPLNYSYYYSNDPDIFVNKAISATYEPGSVIKALTVSAALDSGAVNTDTTVLDSGPVDFSGYIVDNWDKKHHGEISISQVLQLSNNIGAAKVGGLAGRESLHKYFKLFGIGEKLGVDLEGEESGTFSDSAGWYDIDLAAAAFGQGMSTTPLQVVMAFSAIANDGVLMRPYLVERIDKNGKILENKPTQIQRVMSSKTANSMNMLLTEAVSGGEAKYFVSKKYNVAGKTGTAQIAENGVYLDDKSNATFVGFLPSYKDFVMLVKLERPTSSIYASETAVPLWMEISEGVAGYLGLPPDK
ncbi:penicillin-binding protein 2 [bacterium]|nr:penicillin-binding protein 2 [bacterium]